MRRLWTAKSVYCGIKLSRTEHVSSRGKGREEEMTPFKSVPMDLCSLESFIWRKQDATMILHVPIGCLFSFFSCTLAFLFISLVDLIIYYCPFMLYMFGYLYMYFFFSLTLSPPFVIISRRSPQLSKVELLN